MNNSMLLIALAVAVIFAFSCEASHHHHGGDGGGGGGSDHHHHHGGHHGGGGGGSHDHHHHHHHPHHWGGGSSYGGSSYDSSSYYGGGRSYYGGGGGFGLGRLLFGGLFRRPSYYPYYYNYGNYNQGYCRVAQFVDYVGRTPRYYCDCPPYPPNYQWNRCVPMPAYGKK